VNASSSASSKTSSSSSSFDKLEPGIVSRLSDLNPLIAISTLVRIASLAWNLSAGFQASYYVGELRSCDRRSSLFIKTIVYAKRKVLLYVVVEVCKVTPD